MFISFGKAFLLERRGLLVETNMILSKREILEEIKKGNVKIKPFKLNSIGSCSIELRLGHYFRKFKKGKKIKIGERIDENSYSTPFKVETGKTAEMKPGEILLGITLEKIKLSNSICGILEGYSAFARAGLLVYVSSNLVKSGVDNVQVLELVNLSPNTLVLTPGSRICQIYFTRTSSPTEYMGKFKFQTKP